MQEPSHDDVDKRLTELEIKASFAEDTVDLLNQVVIRQQRQIDALTQDIAHLRAQLPAVDGMAAPRSLRDELPPHY